MSQTFESARTWAVSDVDDSFALLRRVIVDPQWNNFLCREYNEAAERLDRSIKRLAKLNECEMESKRPVADRLG